MDLTPEAVRGVEFRRKGRGYEAEDVDDFKAKVEIWAGEMQARLREATTRLDQAETRAREAEERARTSVESDETIQRTLLLAQRTADAAVKEAEETAGRKVAEAEAEADRLLTEARTHRERAISEAEDEVRQAMDAKRAELLDELTTLERTREALSADVAALDGFVESQRARLRDVQTALQQVVEHPDALGPVEPPALSGVEVPEPDATPPPAPEPAVEAELAVPAPLDEVVTGPAFEEPTTPPVADAPEAEEAPSFDEAPGSYEPIDAEWAAPTEAAWDAPPPPPPPPADFEVGAEAPVDEAPPPPPPPPPPDFDVDEPAAASGFGGLPGPVVPSLDDVAEDDNPWLAEMREQEAGEGTAERSRFGRRR